MDDKSPQEWMLIPLDGLEPTTLTSLIESFVLREGTDYGSEESRFSTKVEQVRKQLEDGTIAIVYDPERDSVTLLAKRDLRNAKNQS